MPHIQRISKNRHCNKLQCCWNFTIFWSIDDMPSTCQQQPQLSQLITIAISSSDGTVIKYCILCCIWSSRGSMVWVLWIWDFLSGMLFILLLLYYDVGIIVFCIAMRSSVKQKDTIGQLNMEKLSNQSPCFSNGVKLK